MDDGPTSEGGGLIAPTVEPDLPIRADEVRERLAAVRARVARAGGGRPVDIVAVTKGFGPDAVEAAIDAGVTAIGENYAQELLAKATAGAGGLQTRWHFIGSVQRNKVAMLAPHVALWQTVDRLSLAESIADHAPGAAVLVQVNLAAMPHRGGCAWTEAPDLVAAARSAGLDVRGVMGVGPGGPPGASRAGFAALADLARALGLTTVSMGMTGDLEVAVAEGSTMVRVGTALFGPRPGQGDLRR